ncbi:MAG TPA: alpha/beta hydrolase [Vicinamibacterales bacterium]|nr:alpha/beta hydrolase [Vicinamibacterales bacterium]
MRTIGLLVCFGVSLAAQSGQPVSDVAQKRAAFVKVIDRPRAALAPEVRPLQSSHPDLLEEHFSFAVDSASRATGVLVKRRDSIGRRPVVIQLHGTGGTKEQMLPRLTALAGRGMIGVAIDARYHGERATGGTPLLSSAYLTALFKAYTTGTEHPFYYDTVLDVMRLVDYLGTRADVDAARIGLGGVSKGGIETYLAAAADPRIAAAVPERGVQSFGWALSHSAWDSRAWTIREALEATAEKAREPVNVAFVRRFYDRVAPGIYGEFDGPAMLPLIAPRPLLVINGDSDPRTPMGGVRECAAAAERAYAATGAAEKFELRVLPNVGHENTPEIQRAMVEWFVRWLKP